MKRRTITAVDNAGPTPKKVKGLSGKVQKGSFEHRFERRRYLAQLVDEFQRTDSMDAKQQVLANLANFAYDPYNYQFFQELGIVSIFLAELAVNRNSLLTEFAVAGICNCVADKRIQKEVSRNNGMTLLKQHAYSTAENVILSSITALMYLVESDYKTLLPDEDFENRLSCLSKHRDKRISNVVQILSQNIKDDEGLGLV